MSAAPIYEQPIDAHYTDVLVRHFQRTKEVPPVGWRRARLELSPDATRVDVKEEDKFLEALLKLIREQCCAIDPTNTSRQGLWIEKFDSSEVVNKHLRGSTLKLFPGSASQQVWIEVAPVAGTFTKGDVFRSS
jgi:hypothetical protein